MQSLTDEMQSRVKWTSAVIIGLAIARVAMGVMFMPFSRYNVQWMFYVLPGVIALPALWVIAAVRMRRGTYGAGLVLIVATALVLLMTLISFMPNINRVLGHLMWTLSMLVVPAGVLGASIWAWPAFRHAADAENVRTARRRSALALRMAAGLFVVQALGGFAMVVVLVRRPWDRYEWLVVSISAAIAVALIVSAAIFERMARRARRDERGNVLGIVFAAFAGVGSLVVGMHVRSLVSIFFSDARWTSGLADVAMQGLIAWLLTDLLYARRVAEEPLSYGFQPILTQNDTNAPA